jgi:hypothetical protein
MMNETFYSPEVLPMRTGLVLALGLCAGCTLGDRGRSDVPMETDGPNQVVIKVPTMT